MNTNGDIEVYEGKPPVSKPRGFFEEKNRRMAEMLMRTPTGKSIRVGYGDLKEMRAHDNALRTYIKSHKLEQYIVASSNKPEADGRFYVYLTRKD